MIIFHKTTSTKTLDKLRWWPNIKVTGKVESFIITLFVCHPMRFRVVPIIKINDS